MLIFIPQCGNLHSTLALGSLFPVQRTIESRNITVSIVQYRMGILFPPVLNTPAVPGPFSLAFVCTSWSVCVTLAHTDLPH